MPDRKEEFQCRAEDAKQAVIARLGAGDGDGTAASSAFVAPGWVLDEQGRFMRELKPHMGRRLRGWDYRRPGYYMITLVMADRREGKFGELVVKQPTACAESARRTRVRPYWPGGAGGPECRARARG